MKIIETKLPGVLLIEPLFIRDDRGYFSMTFRKDVLEKYGVNDNFVQENESLSCKNTLRGLHYQIEPYAQAKIVRAVSGKALDIVVDIRKKSTTFGQWDSFILDGSNAIYIPKGFAHGFLALENNLLMQYKCGAVYNKESERGIRWDDSDLGIDWNLNGNEPILSERDKNWPFLNNAKDTF
jgi:dTDP-4-dehydrorhamnose 3,5-epimerase